MRLWKTELREFASVRVAFKAAAGRHSAGQELGVGKPGYLFNDYIDLPAGHGTLELSVGADAHPVVSLPVSLNAGDHLTVLLSEPRQAGGPPRLELIDDNTTASSSTPQITVRNFMRNLKDVRLTVGEVLNAQFISGDSFLQMRGLKPTSYPLRTVGTETDGKPFDWNIDVDLRQNRHQTLLVYPDSYGRIRPRLIVDGEPMATPTPADEGQR